jgi:hypothetical protein
VAGFQSVEPLPKRFGVAALGEDGLMVFRPPNIGAFVSVFGSSGFGTPNKPPVGPGAKEKVGFAPNSPLGASFSAGALVSAAAVFGAGFCAEPSFSLSVVENEPASLKTPSFGPSSVVTWPVD